MLDCIKNTVEKAKTELMAHKATAIAEQKALAQQQVIFPKLAEYQKERDYSLEVAKGSYDKTVSEINADYERKAKEFTEATNKAVEYKVAEAFDKAIYDLGKITDKE